MPIQHSRYTEAMTPKERLIVALDEPDKVRALDMVDRLDGSVKWLKVGLQLYLAEGHGMVEELRERGFDVFLDLKLHDIPNTVAGAVRSATASGASLLTVHAAGGPAMLSAAAEAAASLASAPRLLAVTVLTSMDAAQLFATGVTHSPLEQVQVLASMASRAGVHGLVCSPQEVALLREGEAANALLVVPGIRPKDGSLDDQRRVATPADAVRMGADMLVVGRPITRAADPAVAARNILAELEGL